MCIALGFAGDDVDLTEVLERHGISKSYHAAYERLVETGEIINSDFRLRLNTCQNYQQCADELLQLFPNTTAVVRENPPRYTPE